MESMLLPYRKLYRLIEGRSGRREFWMFTLFVWVVSIASFALLFGLVGASAASFGDSALDPLQYGSAMAGAGIGVIIFVFVFYIWTLLSGVASFAVSVRRLHDMNFSGWFLVLFYVVLLFGGMIHWSVTLLAVVAWIVFMALPGTQGPNKYDTADGSQAEVFA